MDNNVNKRNGILLEASKDVAHIIQTWANEVKESHLSVILPCVPFPLTIQGKQAPPHLLDKP